MELQIDEQLVNRFMRKFAKYPAKIQKAGKNIVDWGLSKLEHTAANLVRGKIGNIRALATGNLMRGIHYTMKADKLSGEVVSLAPYSIYVHEGTKYMKARPYFTQAIAREEADINKYAAQVIKQALK